MKVLLDQCLPVRAAGLLRDAGVDAVHTRETGLQLAPDEVILQAALDAGRFVATLDSDFHEILALTRASAPSVYRIRAEHLSAQQVRDATWMWFASSVMPWPRARLSHREEA